MVCNHISWASKLKVSVINLKAVLYRLNIHKGPWAFHYRLQMIHLNSIIDQVENVLIFFNLKNSYSNSNSLISHSKSQGNYFIFLFFRAFEYLWTRKKQKKKYKICFVTQIHIIFNNRVQFFVFVSSLKDKSARAQINTSLKMFILRPKDQSN